MSDLTAFLLARLGEDEAEARATMTYESERRRLAECEAKRQIVEIHALVQGDSTEYTWSASPHLGGRPTGIQQVVGCDNCRTATVDGDQALIEGPCGTLLALAAVYSGHPEFDPSWAVSGE